MSIEHEPRVLRLRSIELLRAGASVQPEHLLDAKRHGIDAWVHEVPWSRDASRKLITEHARKIARPDFPFALCLRLSGQSAVATPQRLHEIVETLGDRNQLTVGGRPLLFVRDDQQSTDLMGFVQPIRHAVRVVGLREPILVRVAVGSELEGATHLPGFDEVVWLPGACECTSPRSRAAGERPRLENVTDCIVVGDPDQHRVMVANAIRSQIDVAVAHDRQQTQIYVHTCRDWSDAARSAQDAGVIDGMESMPSFPRAAAPYGATSPAPQQQKRPALSVVLVAESNPEATMVCLQSALDTSSDLGDMQFVVVDNASTDETRALIEALGDNVTSLRNETAKPLREAWEQAIKLASGELILMISNDVVIGLGWHEPLVRALATDPTCNAVSPAIAIGTNHMPTQPPAINSGVCLLARGDAARAGTIGDARFVDESVVFLRVESPERIS